MDGIMVESPFTFPNGTSTVVCTASSSLGVATCTFTVTVKDAEAPLVGCRPAPNPSGKNVPGSKSATPNPNGFFQLLAKDNCDSAPQIYVRDSASAFVAGPFANGDLVKITSDPAVTPVQKKMGGVVNTHILIKGTALLFARDASGNASSPEPGCGLP